MMYRPIHILCRALPPLLRQPAFAILPAGLLTPAGHFTGCEQPVHNRSFQAMTINRKVSLFPLVKKTKRIVIIFDIIVIYEVLHIP